jgi:hypothetical protein
MVRLGSARGSLLVVALFFAPAAQAMGREGIPESWGLRWGVGGLVGADGIANGVGGGGGLGVYGRLGFQWGNHVGTEAELSGTYGIETFATRLSLLFDWNFTSHVAMAFGPCFAIVGPFANVNAQGSLYAATGRFDYNFLVERTRWGRRNAMSLSVELDVGNLNVAVQNIPTFGAYVMLGYLHY